MAKPRAWGAALSRKALPGADEDSRRRLRQPGIGMNRRRFVGLLLGAAGGAAASPGVAASEAEIKAAMLFHFTKFIEWPAGRTDGPLVVGVAGDDAVRDALAELARERTSARGVQVRRVEQPAEAEACHLLFLGQGARKRTADFLAAPRRGLVTVGDAEAFVKAGGAIGFLVADNKLRFEVNLAAANQAGVTISSRLLRLAQAVRS